MIRRVLRQHVLEHAGALPALPSVRSTASATPSHRHIDAERVAHGKHRRLIVRANRVEELEDLGLPARIFLDALRALGDARRSGADRGVPARRCRCTARAGAPGASGILKSAPDVEATSRDTRMPAARRAGCQIADDVLDPVDDGVVPEIRPAVVHVEQGDIHDVVRDGRRERFRARRGQSASAASDRWPGNRRHADVLSVRGRCRQSNGIASAPFTTSDGTWPPPDVTLASPVAAQSRQKTRQLAAEEIRRAVDEHVADLRALPGSNFGNSSRRT